MVTSAANAKGGESAERHFCSGKCLGTWVDVEVARCAKGNARVRASAERFSFTKNGIEPGIFGLDNDCDDYYDDRGDNF